MERTSIVEDLNPITKQIKVTIPAEEVSKAVEASLSTVMKQARIKGFRPGKAPRHLVEKLHGGEIRSRVAQDLISSSLEELLKEHKIPVVGTPSINVASIEPLEYTADVSVYPTPEVTGYERFEISVPKREPGDADIDRVIGEMRKAKAKIVPLAFRQTAEASDVIEASIELFVDGKSLGRPEPVTVGLDEGRLPKEVVDGIVGQEIGSTREISVAMSPEHPRKELRGKTVVYKVTLDALSEKALPEVTDEFAADVDPEAPTVLALRMKVRSAIEEDAVQEARSRAQALILDELLKGNEFEVPSALVDDELRNMLVRSGLVDPSRADIERLAVDSIRSEYGPLALQRVRSAIVVDRIGEKENIEVTEEDVNDAIEQLAKEHGQPVEGVRRQFAEGPGRQRLELEISRDKVLEFLTDRATITYTAPEPEPEPQSAEGDAATEGEGTPAE